MFQTSPFRALCRPGINNSLLVSFILLSLALTSCTRAQPASVTATSSSAPFTTSTSTPVPTSLPKATRVSNLTPSWTPPHNGKIISTSVPEPLPYPDPESYRLKQWDWGTAQRLLIESDKVSVPDEISNLRPFYQVSLLYEILLQFPYESKDSTLLHQMAEVKGLGETYFSGYGMLHDHSTESFRQMLENAMNEGRAYLAYLPNWVSAQDANVNVSEHPVSTSSLFDQPVNAQVFKVNGYIGWNFFIVRSDAPNRFSVFTLYPEWERYWWNDEVFQITDLNGNGRDEIAITRDEWGTGISHFCRKSFHLYEWDGSAFQDLMIDPLEVLANTDYGSCHEVTFLPDGTGKKMIQSGTELYTLCPEVPYEEVMSFHWNGRGFIQETGIRRSPPPNSSHPDKCTVDWALKAGLQNDAAVNLLAEALDNWPPKAEEEWGPAARDFFRLKLSTWYLRRGQMEHGLALLRQVRDHPAAPAYPLPQRVAATFLDTFAAEGLFRAVKAVNALLDAELLPVSGQCFEGCNVENLRREWGFAEREWEATSHFGTPDYFRFIPALTLTIKQAQPNTMHGLLTLLEQSEIHPLWSVQGDLDGNGTEDWLVEVERTTPDYVFYDLYAFLQHSGEIVLLDDLHVYLPNGANTETLRWQSFRPDPGTSPVNILQAGDRLYAFRLCLDCAEQVTMDIDSWTIVSMRKENRVRLQNWKIEEGRLVVQYDNNRETVYIWDPAQKKMVPTGYAPELQEEHVREVEQALYRDNNPIQAIKIIKEMLGARIYEEFDYDAEVIRPYLQYMLGLAYERSGDEDSAVREYWNLWKSYPASLYSLAARSKLERR